MSHSLRFSAASSSKQNANPVQTLQPAASTVRDNVVPQGTDFGYFTVGGNSNSTTINRIDYSNDTETATAKGPLSAARYATDGTGSASHGYVGGGYGNSASGAISSVDRLDYFNDTRNGIAKGPLSLARREYSSGPTSSSSFGYFMGGFRQIGAYSRVDRIDYSNDTATATPKGPLSQHLIIKLVQQRVIKILVTLLVVFLNQQ